MIFADNLYSVISSTGSDASAVRYTVRLLSDSVIFKAHFPGEPIMPGACIVQMVVELFNTWQQCEAEVAKVVNLKFLSVISPDAVSQLDVVIEIKKQEAQTVQIKADLVAGDTEYTKMSLLLNLLS